MPQAWILNRLCPWLFRWNRFEELNKQDYRRKNLETQAKETFKLFTEIFIKQIDQSDLGLSQVFLLKGLENPVVKAYHSFQVDMAVLYGADKERADREMKEAFDFETGLAKVRKYSSRFIELLIKFSFTDFASNWKTEKRDGSIQLNVDQGPSAEIPLERLGKKLRQSIWKAL